MGNFNNLGRNHEEITHGTMRGDRKDMTETWTASESVFVQVEFDLLKRK